MTKTEHTEFGGMGRETLAPLRFSADFLKSLYEKEVVRRLGSSVG